MATTANILTLLKFYASRQKSPMIDYAEFADYIKRYAQHHLEENPDLISFIGSTDSLQKELDDLVQAHQIVLVTPSANKQLIFVASFFIEKYTQQYHDIETNISVPFPNINDLPKNTPTEIVNKQTATDLIYELLAKKEMNDKTLYGLTFVKDVPTLLMPSSVSMDVVVNLALNKIREMLHKEEYHDYFLKKLSISNPGKEMTAKNFFNAFVQKPENALEALKSSGENFYFWSQLCYFIKQDYDKLKDFTIEDINILQSVCITEAATSFYKSKAVEKIQKENALNMLDKLLRHPPYFFTFTDISKMKDNNGVLLINQYSERELRDHLEKMSTQSSPNQLPDLLVFKTQEDEHYFIFKDKVMSLIVRLCSDARVTVRDNICSVWKKSIQEFETVPEMKDQAAFERCLQRETQATQPVLYALLNASFLPLVSYDPTSGDSDDTPGKLLLFRDGSLIPYSEILMMSRQEIYTDVKIKLPFYYTMPVISWIASLLLRKPKDKRKKDASKTAAEKVREEQKKNEEEKRVQKEIAEAGDPRQSRKVELRQAAQNAESAIVPPNSTLDRELFAYCHEWNNLIGKETHDNLTEDVNSLIRDYMRKVLRTLSSTGFTPERIKSLAESLVSSPSLQKIKNQGALEMYTELYMIKLVKNLP